MIAAELSAYKQQMERYLAARPDAAEFRIRMVISALAVVA
jgi:hypothetical protein